MKKYYIYISIIAACVLVACAENHDKAKQHLSAARAYLAINEFEKAKAEIDSVNLYTKAFEQRKAGIPLLDSIRKAENNTTVEAVDAQISLLLPQLDIMKKDFVFQKDEKRQEVGLYIPKIIAGSGVLSYTTLNSGVQENGQLYLESIYVGGQKHNKLKVSAGDKSAESLTVEGDGYIHRFNDLGVNYEIVTFTGSYENGLAKFIAENSKSVLRAQLSGGHNTSYTLPQNVKTAIEKSYALSTQMLLIDSLKNVKEQAEFKNFYLDNGKKTSVPMP